jgi:hypothetical protein
MPYYKIFFNVISLFLLLSFQSIFASQEVNDNSSLMGNEANILLQKRLVDPIKTGKRTIRILVSYNATNYFIIKGKQAGLEYELMNSFEKYLNKGRSAEKKVHFIFISLPFDQLIPA